MWLDACNLNGPLSTSARHVDLYQLQWFVAGAEMERRYARDVQEAIAGRSADRRAAGLARSRPVGLHANMPMASGRAIGM